VTSLGEHYDAVQSHIRYNHLAVVERGRAGNARLRLDAADAVHGAFEQEDDMADPTGPKLTTVRLDDLDYAAAPEVARALTKLQDEHTTRQRGYDSLQAERDSIQGQVAEAVMILSQVVEDSAERERGKTDLSGLAKALVQQIKGMESRIRARIVLEETARKHEVKFDEKATDRDIRVAVVGKLRGDAIRFDDKSDDYVASAYDIAINLEGEKTKKVGESRVVADSKDPKAGSSEQPKGARAARAGMVNRITERSSA